MYVNPSTIIVDISGLIIQSNIPGMEKRFPYCHQGHHRLVQPQTTEGSKTPLVARSSRSRCAQHLRRFRRCDAHPAWIWLMSCKYYAQNSLYDVRHVARVHHANVARGGMLLLDPSVQDYFALNSNSDSKISINVENNDVNSKNASRIPKTILYVGNHFD
jgi:hypothetical protein